LLDTLGELAALYSRATVAFVGGTLAPIGGHNLLEPAQAGVPVVFGPSIDNVRDAAARLEAVGGGIRVADEDALVAAIDALIAHPEDAARRGRAAAAAAITGGVAARTLAAMDAYLPRAG
jgi:3-deoxy-D-manno-octulosonic-acid transferase